MKNTWIKYLYLKDVVLVCAGQFCFAQIDITNAMVAQARKDLGVKYKDMTPQPLRDYIYEINKARHEGDKLGPTYDYLKNVDEKSDLEIIDSSSRPNTDIDSLLGDFENWLREQR